jgi:IS5 family transposase
MAQDLTNKRYRYKNRVDEIQKAKNRNKSRVRSKVEHVFGVIKRKFGYVKVRYRGIYKNANQVFALCALSNLFVSRHRLLSTQTA